jgi:hypothetical protein
VFVKEILDQLPVLGAREPRPAMPVAGDDLQRDLHAGLFEGFGQGFTLAWRHDAVLVAVHDQEGGRVLADVGQGARLAGLFLILPDGTADQAGLRRIGLTANRMAGQKSLLPVCHAPPWIQTITGRRPSARSGK